MDRLRDRGTRYAGQDVEVEFFLPAFFATPASQTEIYLYRTDTSVYVGKLANFSNPSGSSVQTPPIFAKKRLGASLLGTYNFTIRVEMIGTTSGVAKAGDGNTTNFVNAYAAIKQY